MLYELDAEEVIGGAMRLVRSVLGFMHAGFIADSFGEGAIATSLRCLYCSIQLYSSPAPIHMHPFQIKTSLGGTL